MFVSRIRDASINDIVRNLTFYRISMWSLQAYTYVPTVWSNFRIFGHIDDNNDDGDLIMPLFTSMKISLYP